MGHRERAWGGSEAAARERRWARDQGSLWLDVAAMGRRERAWGSSEAAAGEGRWETTIIPNYEIFMYIISYILLYSNNYNREATQNSFSGPSIAIQKRITDLQPLMLIGPESSAGEISRRRLKRGKAKRTWKKGRRRLWTPGSKPAICSPFISKNTFHINRDKFDKNVSASGIVQGIEPSSARTRLTINPENVTVTSFPSTAPWAAVTAVHSGWTT